MKHVFRLVLCTSFIALFATMGLGVGTAVAASALMTASDSKAHAANSEGIEHYNQEHWEVAHGHFMKAVEADPASGEAHYNLALALDKMGQHKDAAMEFQKAQDLGKDNPDIQNSEILLGHVKMLKGAMWTYASPSRENGTGQAGRKFCPLARPEGGSDLMKNGGSYRDRTMWPA